MHMHTIKATDASWWSLKWVNGVIARIIPYLSILWCRIDHPALLHKLNTVYDNAKYWVFHLAKTQQNMVLGVRKPI